MEHLFTQTPPQLGNQYAADRVVRSYLQRTLPPEMLSGITPELDEMGALAGGELYQMQLADRLNEPILTQWDAWGRRVDRIEVSPLWRMAEKIAAERGLVALPYEQRHGRFSRLHQFALVYLFTASTDIYACPLAMTDGAAKTLSRSGNRELIAEAVPHLTARDPAQFWTSGQWMTEATGGSDVGLSQTVAQQDDMGAWWLSGRKWFTSAAASQMALTLARPVGNPSGGAGLALFYIQTRDADGLLRNIVINRLKDKLGTRKVPTAELELIGTPARPVCGVTDGVRNIAPMLNITRVWNSVSALALMRRGLALAFDYARRRVAFGAALAEKPLHVDTLAGLQAEFEAAFHLTFYVVELLGREETNELDETQAALLRLLTPLTKALTGKQAVTIASEVLECFGGAGYVEDTGLPALLRDSQVLPIWEGTTNVLSLDALRALGRDGAGWRALASTAQTLAIEITEPQCAQPAQEALKVLGGAAMWLAEAQNCGAADTEAGARRWALTVARSFALVLLARHAHYALTQENDMRPLFAARRFARNGVSLITAVNTAEAVAHLSSEYQL